MKTKVIFTVLLCCLCVSCKQKPSVNMEATSTTQQSDNPTLATDDFVNISDVVPDALLEIRYYSAYNFVGARVDGYEQSAALMTRQSADSLRAVADELRAKGYAIKVYDAYRPQMAVDHFVRWGEDINDTAMRQVFYPNVDKKRLFELEYIARQSSHTRGSTVDLTLFDIASGKELDMGGPFDWFGRESHPDCGGRYVDKVRIEYLPNDTISREQFDNRMLLREAMMNHGFKPYECEWWHFTLKDEPYPDTYFNFPVRKL